MCHLPKNHSTNGKIRTTQEIKKYNMKTSKPEKNHDHV